MDQPQGAGQHLLHSEVRDEAPTAARPLNPDERALLEHLLAVDVPDIGVLREQASVAQVVPNPELPWNLYFHIPQSAPRASSLRSRAISSAGSLDYQDPYAVDLLLWLRAGFLYSIEISWFDKRRDTVPTVSELTPAEASEPD